MATTIQIDNSVKRKLDLLKFHKRETYNDLIFRLIENFPKAVDKESLTETIEILSDPETMRNIAEGLEEFRQGKGIEFNDLKKELDLNV